MGSCTPIVDGVAGGAAAGLEPTLGTRKQYQTALADITGRGIASPIGFWSFDQVDTEAVTGGVGYDFVRPGVSGFGSMYSYVDGEIGQSDEVFAGFWDRTSMAEVNNEPVWKLPSTTHDMSASVIIRPNQYEGVSYTQEQGLLSYVHRSSATLGATTYPTYLLWLEPMQAANCFQPRVGYYDSGGALVSVGWQTAGGDAIGLRVGNWYQVGFTRTRNGVNDVDLELYVNGRSVATLLAQNDTGDPTSTNMRLIAGARISSGDEYSGSMRDVAIWDETISAADMLNMWKIAWGISA